MRLGYADQVVISSWNECQQKSGQRSIHIALQPYMIYYKFRMMFEVTDSRKEGQALRLHRACYAGGSWGVLSCETADAAEAQEALNSGDAVDEALSYISPAMFSTPHTLVEDSQLYTLEDEKLSDWPEVSRCQLGTGLLLLAFRNVASTVMELLEVKIPKASTTQVMEVDLNRNVVTRELQPFPRFRAVLD